MGSKNLRIIDKIPGLLGIGLIGLSTSRHPQDKTRQDAKPKIIKKHKMISITAEGLT
jgi:hypothetical protein